MIQYLYLGRLGYEEALGLQEELVVRRQRDSIANTLLLLEHPPVLTLGRNAKRSNVLASDQVLAARGITLHEINRGGDVTYHGPGQLIGYPIFDLRSLRNRQGGRLGPVDFVRLMEEALIGLCATYGVAAARIPGLTGVWCHPGNSGTDQLPSQVHDRPQPAAKIAAIGIHVSRGVTSHGFAFNLSTDLRDFALINPCGITDRPVTSLEREIARSGDPNRRLPTLEALAGQAMREFGLTFGEQVLAIESPMALCAQKPSKAAPESQRNEVPAQHLPVQDLPARDFPAEDTPLKIPRELERLRNPGRKDRPAKA